MLRFQLALAAQYLWGRKLRTALTTLAIVFGALVIFMMNIIMPTMMAAFQANMLAASGQVDITITHASRESFSDKTINKVKNITGVRAIAGSLSRTVNIPAGYYPDSQIGALTLTGIHPKNALLLRPYPVKAGRFLRPTDTKEAVITTSLAQSIGLELGDAFNLPTTEGSIEFVVIGLLPERSLPGNEEILITLDQAQKLLDLPDRINTLEINLNTSDEAQREAIQKQIETALGDEFTLGGLTSGSELLASVRTGQVAFNLIGFLALLMGGFIIFNTFRTIIAERRHDIGMLRALGASRGTIIGLILAEGLLQGLVGSAIGMLAGYALGAGLLLTLKDIMTDMIHLELGAPVVQPGLVALTLSLGVGVTLLAGLIPALSASRVTPLEALRPTVQTVGESRLSAGLVIGILMLVVAVVGLFSSQVPLAFLGGLCFLIGLVLVAPALVRPVAAACSALIALLFARDGVSDLAEGNLTRQPGRAAVTASATMIGLAIIVGMGGMIWSLTGGFISILEKSLGSDYLVMPPSVAVWGSNVGAKAELAEELRQINGVEVVSAMRYASAVAAGKSVTILGIDPVDYPQVSSLNFTDGNSEQAFTGLGQENTLIANGVFASQVGLKRGDVVRISTPTGAKDYRLVAIAGDYLNAKIMTAYTSHDNLYADFRKDEDIFIQINLAPKADTVKVEAKMKEILEDYPQFKLVSGQSYLDENRALFDSIFAFYFILLAVLALPSLIALLNTLAIGVIERTREIGMLRAIGATRKQVRRIILIESLLLAAIGTAFGLVAGLYLGYVMILGLSTGGFPVQYVFPYAGLAAALVTGLLFGVLAAVLPARQAAGLDIIRALRYE